MVDEFTLDDPNGWFNPPVRRVPSPNFDDRPDDSLDVVVIHSISLPPGEYGGRHVEELFTNRLSPTAHPYFAEIASLRVSAHLLIDRGGAVVQFVPLGKRAWHAGESSCLGRTRVNDFSIGIELEGCDTESFTLRQYEVLSALLREIRVHWPHIGAERLFGHCDIAAGRKTDPGPFFEWNRLFSML
jgi:AmpD protein